MAGYFILLSSLRSFNFCVVELNKPHFFQVKMGSYICSQADRYSLRWLNSSISSTSDQHCFCYNFTISRIELACLCISRKYLISFCMPHVVLVAQGHLQINSYHPDSSLSVVFHYRVPANGEISYYCPLSWWPWWGFSHFLLLYWSAWSHIWCFRT